MPLTVVDHPVARHLLTRLRNQETEPYDFRALAEQLAGVLALEASRSLPTQDITIRTPLEETSGERIAVGISAVAVLRAGLGMLDAIARMFPDVTVGTIGLERDERTAEPRGYYSKLPDLHSRVTMLLDPMLATGGTACYALRLLRDSGAERMQMLCAVAAPEGVERVLRDFPEVEIFTAALDRGLDEKRFIRPGLGDFGDRLFGTT